MRSTAVMVDKKKVTYDVNDQTKFLGPKGGARFSIAAGSVLASFATTHGRQRVQ
jgi:hypothetical protein